MNFLFSQWSALIISIGSLVIAWSWSTMSKCCARYWKFLCHAVLMEGPSALPIIGNAHWFAGSPEDVFKQLRKIAEPYTIPFRLWVGPKLFIVITDPSDIEMVINNPEVTYKSSEYRFTESFFGHGLMTSSGPEHRIYRNLITPMMIGETLDMYIDSFDIQSRRCVERLENMIGTKEFDILPFIDNCTTDIIMNTIIGCLALAQDNGYSELVESIIKLVKLSHERILKVWLHPDYVYFNTQRGKEYKKAVTVVSEFMNDIVAEKKREYYNLKNRNEPSDILTGVLLEQLIAYNEVNKLVDDVRLRDEMSTLFLVVQDLTAITCAFTLMMLGMHSEIQDKVRKEVQEVVGDENMTVQIESKLKYLDMVIKETLRLFPVGPILLRKVQKDFELDTCTVPEGCTIAMFLFMTHRDPRFWDEPDKFNPDRFLPKNSVGRHPYTFTPFASGLRDSIGQQYTMMVVKSLVVRVVKKYRLHSNESLENLKLNANISMRVSNGFKVSIAEL